MVDALCRNGLSIPQSDRPMSMSTYQSASLEIQCESVYETQQLGNQLLRELMR